MPIVMSCSECGTRYKFKDGAAGKWLNCKSCGKYMKVPTEDVEAGDDLMGVMPPAASAGDGADGRPPKVGGKSKWRRPGQGVGASLGGRWKLIAAIVAGTVAVAGLAFGIYRFVESTRQINTQTGPMKKSVDATSKVAGNTDGSNAEADGSKTQGDAYPALPDAVSKAPLWIRDSAPFDMYRYFDAPQPDENGAGLYLDALFEFSSGLGECFSEKEKLERTPAIRQRTRQFIALYNRWKADPESVTGTEIDSCLRKYGTAFDKLGLAQERERCVFQTGIDFAAGNQHAQTAREVANVFTFRIGRALARKQFDESIAHLEMLLRLIRDLRPRGSITTQQITLEMERVAYQQLPELLRSPNITVEHCDKLVATLSFHESKTMNPFIEGLKTNYLTSRVLLNDVQYRTGNFNPDRMQAAFGVNGDSIGYVLATSLFRTSSESIVTKSESLDKRIAEMRPEDFVEETHVLDECYESLLGLRTRSFRDWPRTTADVEKRLRDETVLLSFAGPFSKFANATIYNTALLRGSKCLAALRRWQLEYTSPPKEMQSVTKRAGMTASPIDPYSGGPFRLATVDAQTVVYSIGPDGRDDNGLDETITETVPDAAAGRDLVFRLIEPKDSNSEASSPKF